MKWVSRCVADVIDDRTIVVNEYDLDHTPAAFRTPGTSPNGVPGNFVFHPFSDFLIHDMGALGDQIGVNAGESVAQTRQMRTAPLWGLRNANRLLHDGSATTIEQAIQRHDGQARGARDRFAALDADSVARLLAFLRSL